MPLFEFLKMARGKLESHDQKKNSSTADLSACPEDDLVELVWENGQITMQDQSSRAKKSPGNSSNSKIEKFGVVDSMLNDMPLSVHTGDMDLTREDDEVVPWLSYSSDDSLQQDYCSQLLPEMSDVMANEPSGQRGFASMGKRDSSNQMIGDSRSVPNHDIVNLEQRNASKLSPSSRFSQLSSWTPQEGSASVLSLGSGASDVICSTRNNRVSFFGDSNPSQASAAGIKSMKMQKQNMRGSDSSLSNFSHFSRPVTLLKANLQNVTGGSAVSGSPTIEARGNKDRENVASSRNPASAVLVEPYFRSEKENDLRSPRNMASSKVKSRTSMASVHDRPRPVEQSDNLCRCSPSKNDKSLGQFPGVNATQDIPHADRNVEPGVACSSEYSGSSAERASSDQPHNLKRKNCDNGESEFPSEDVEESNGVKKAGPSRGGTASKRSRAAEVHNLSERRRRDRINEKMRALQELIPNCNKADKASMLDEAIEYLKTLQLQVQMMSMGTGLCVPPMMFPTGMQHMHAAHMPRFSPMGIGMGMGMGYGMGMLEMNGGSPGCPIYPMPTMQGARFPSPPISGSTTFPGVAGSNLHAFAHPRQGVPVSAPRAPLVPLARQPLTSSPVILNVARAGFHIDVPSSTPILDPKNVVHQKNSQIIHNADPSGSISQTSNQVQATNEGLRKSALVRKNDQLPDINDCAANNLTNQTDVLGSDVGSN